MLTGFGLLPVDLPVRLQVDTAVDDGVDVMFGGIDDLQRLALLCRGAHLAAASHQAAVHRSALSAGARVVGAQAAKQHMRAPKPR